MEFLRRLEFAELVDVGARGKGLVAGPAQHQHLDGPIVIGLLANGGEPLVHGEGEGVARLRAVESDPPDAVVAFKNEVVRRYGLVHFLDPRCFLYF